jgi:hypothetical protein
MSLVLLVGGCADKASLGRYEGSSSSSSSSSTSGTGTGAGTAGSTDGGGTGNETTGSGPDVAGGTTTGDPESDGGDDMRLDMLVPQIATCSVEATEQVDLVISTPAGSIEGLHAWWGWEGCCGPMPRLIVADAESLELDADWGVLVTEPVLEVLIQPDSGTPGVWTGMQPSLMRFHGDASDADLPADFTLSNVITFDERAVPPALEGDIAVGTDGWSVSGHVVAPYCMSIDTPPCPCE